jgi:hypothetical protein
MGYVVVPVEAVAIKTLVELMMVIVEVEAVVIIKSYRC